MSRKMKFLNNLTALLLVVAVTFISITPLNASGLSNPADSLVSAFRSQAEFFVSEDGMTSTTSFEMNGIVYVLRSIETPNGDIIFYEYQNGILVNRAAIFANQNDRIIETIFDSVLESGQINEPTERVIMLESISIESVEILEEQIPMELVVPFNSINGTITYRHQDMWGVFPDTLHRVTVTSSQGFGGQTTHRITNQWATLAAWGGIFAMVLSIPGWMAGAAASWAVFSLGAVSTAGGFTFSHAHIAAIRTPFTVNTRYLNQTFSPLTFNRYVINSVDHPHLLGETFWEGSFHWRIQWQTQNLWGFFSFADVIHFHTLAAIYGGMTRWSIHSW